MTRRILFIVPAVILLVGSLFFFSGTQHSRAEAIAQPERNTRIAAPGRVEPVSEEILVSPEIKRLINNGALRMVGPGPHVSATSAATSGQAR